MAISNHFDTCEKIFLVRFILFMLHVLKKRTALFISLVFVSY